MKFFKKKLTIGGLIAFVLVAVLVAGIISALSSGTVFWRAVNEDNLYTAKDVELESSEDNGLAFKVRNDGSFTVKGTAKEDETYLIANIKLDAGTYNITAIDKMDDDEAYVSVYVDGIEYTADTSANIFNISADDTVVTVKLTVFEDAEIDIDVYPVIVEGEKSADFYK